jgi:hypothetical protein
VLIEKNVGATHRNSNVTNDTATCAAFVALVMPPIGRLSADAFVARFGGQHCATSSRAFIRASETT